MTLLFMLWSLLSYNSLSIIVATVFKAHCFQAKIQYSHATLDNMTGPADNAFGQHMMLRSIHSFLNMFKKKKKKKKKNLHFLMAYEFFQRIHIDFKKNYTLA